MNENKVAPEAISAPIPDDLKALYETATDHGAWAVTISCQRAKELIERIASLESENARARHTITQLIELRDAHKNRADKAEQQLAALKNETNPRRHAGIEEEETTDEISQKASSY